MQASRRRRDFASSCARSLSPAGLRNGCSRAVRTRSRDNYAWLGSDDGPAIVVLATALILHVALRCARHGKLTEDIGYCEIRLDTLPSMTGAQSLYLRLGFEVIAPYYDTPVVGTLFMGRRLRP